jgi:hypothetical protein
MLVTIHSETTLRHCLLCLPVTPERRRLLGRAESVGALPILTIAGIKMRCMLGFMFVTFDVSQLSLALPSSFLVPTQ